MLVFQLADSRRLRKFFPFRQERFELAAMRLEFLVLALGFLRADEGQQLVLAVRDGGLDPGNVVLDFVDPIFQLFPLDRVETLPLDSPPAST